MEKIKKEIQKSNRVLVTSHTNCDQDGICSALAVKLIIEKNFNKKVLVNIESALQKNISFLKGYDDIKTENLFEKIKEFKPDLIIFTDSSSLSRFSSNSDDIKSFVKAENIATMVIDHHRSKIDFDVDYEYNNYRSSCAQEVYHLFVEEMNLKIDLNIAEVILTGMIFDTGVFTYKNNAFRETANVVSNLVEKGVNVEKILGYKNKYFLKDISVFTELNKNLVLKKGFTYSFISEEFLENSDLTPDELKNAYQIWMSLFLRNIGGNTWGFIVRPKGKKLYEVSFRSQENSPNVRELAEELGGGGHDYASGATLEGENIKSVIEKIMSKIL